MTAALRREGIATEFKMRSGTFDPQGVVFAKNGYPFNGSKIDRQFSYPKICTALEQNRRQAETTDGRRYNRPADKLSHLLEDLLRPVYNPDEEGGSSTKGNDA